MTFQKSVIAQNKSVRAPGRLQWLGGLSDWHSAWLLPWLVFAIGLAITYSLQRTAFEATLKAQRSSFTSYVREMALDIEQHMVAYEQTLRGVKGLYLASKSVERDEFRDYVDILRIDHNFPGIQGIGFSQIIPAQELAAHVDAIHQEGFPEYSIFPEGQREIFTSIIYLEPEVSPQNSVAFQ